MAEGTAGVVLTVIAITDDEAVAVVTQPALEVMITLTVFPLVNVLLVYVAVDPPTVAPFNFHKYVGAVPPYIGLAENVTRAPGQIVLDGDALIVTEGVCSVPETITLTVLLNAHEPLTD